MVEIEEKEEGFLQLVRGEELNDLVMNDMYAFTLLSIIAIRARWSKPKKLTYTELQLCECVLGRKEVTKGKYAMSEQNFRSALKRLEKRQLITTKPTKHGTIVKLLGTIVYDINARNRQPTTHSRSLGRPHRRHWRKLKPWEYSSYRFPHRNEASRFPDSVGRHPHR